MRADAVWSGRRVFVTGATGFLGSHLTRALRASGAHVSVLDGDIRDRALVRARVEAARPSVVFHLAAYGTTPLQQDAARMREVNVGGIENVVGGARRLSMPPRADRHLRRVRQRGRPDHRIDRLPPVVAGTRRRCTTPSCSLRMPRGGVGGSSWCCGRSARSVPAIDRSGSIPHVVDGLVSRRRVAVTRGEFCRDYSYVDDHITALMSAGSATIADTGRVYNIGSGKPVTVRTVVEAIAALVGGDAIDRVDFAAIPYRDDDCVDRYAAIDAARRELCFDPKVPLADGLRWTIEAARREAAR